MYQCIFERTNKNVYELHCDIEIMMASIHNLPKSKHTLTPFLVFVALRCDVLCRMLQELNMFLRFPQYLDAHVKARRHGHDRGPPWLLI